MASRLAFCCPASNGLHARPAGQLAEVAKQFGAEITLINERTEERVNAKSVLAIISADVREGDSCLLEAVGGDEIGAIERLDAFVRDELPSIDEIQIELGPAAPCVSHAFMASGASWANGTPLSPGIGRGSAVKAGRPAFPERVDDVKTGTPQEELQRLYQALSKNRKLLAEQIRATVGDVHSAILAAHLAIVDDVELLAEMEALIRDGKPATESLIEVVREFTKRLRSSRSDYIRGRAVDVEDVGLQILNALCGFAPPNQKIELNGPSVIVAEDLTPQQLMSLDRKCIKALILESAEATSHAAILARSMGVPALTGVSDDRMRFSVGEDVLVDANMGIVVREPDANAAKFFERETRTRRRRQERLKLGATRDAVTRDGRRIGVAVNVNCSGDLESEVFTAADGIGLLRSEIAFSDRKKAPSEREHYELYVKALEAARGQSVTVRTFDVGADKPLQFFRLPQEANPFLGCRGVRNYNKHFDVIRDQLRAIVRASAKGPVRLMTPMIATVDEAIWMRDKVAEIQHELEREGASFDPKMPVGVMVEVPLVCYAIDELSEVVDFFSIGTNDLSQYFSAADRCNPTVSALGNVLHPAFLRVLDMTTRAARKHSKPVYMCGDMAGDVRCMPLLIGLGIEEISAAASEAYRLKEAVGRYSAKDCEELLKEAMQCRTAREVERLLNTGAGIGSDGDEEMLSRDLILMDLDCADKAEALKLMVDELFVAGRTDRPHRVEDAIWRREQECATGLGHGFAIPHCKSETVKTSTVAAARLRRPIEWGSVDEKPVEFVILLAMNAADQKDAHMEVFSTLARRLMHEDFRAGLLGATDAGEMYEFIKSELKAKD